MGRRSLQIGRIKQVLRLYRELGTYENVGKWLGITRERVRQILQKGSQYGIWDFQKESKEIRLNHVLGHYPSKEKLEAKLQKGTSFIGISRDLGLTTDQLRLLLRHYGIKNYSGLIRANRDAHYMALYNSLVSKLGNHPSASEIYDANSRRGFSRSLYVWMSWHYGGIKKFRAKFFPNVDFGRHYHTSSYYLEKRSSHGKRRQTGKPN